MLGDHDGPGSEGGAPDTGDGEELDEAGEVVAVADDFGFFEDLSVDVVEIAGGLKAGVAEAAEGLECLGVAVFLIEEVSNCVASRLYSTLFQPTLMYQRGDSGQK